MPGARRRGRPRTTWIDNIKSWTGLFVEESVRMTEINGESTSMVWPTLGSRTAKEQNSKVVSLVVKYTSICIALYHDSSLQRSGMARVNEESHSFTCHPHVYPWVERAIPAFTPQSQSTTALWLVLISRPAEGRRLSWPGWLCEILRWFACWRRSPIPVLTGPDVKLLHWYAKHCYHCATPPQSIGKGIWPVKMHASYLQPFCFWGTWPS